MSDTDRVPDGMIDADPPGGWESGDVADRTTAEADRAAEGSPDLVTDGDEPAGPVETDDASADADPDLSAPAQTQEQ